MKERLLEAFDGLDEEQKDEVIIYAQRLLEIRQGRGDDQCLPLTADPQ